MGDEGRAAHAHGRPHPNQLGGRRAAGAQTSGSLSTAAVGRHSVLTVFAYCRAQWLMGLGAAGGWSAGAQCEGGACFGNPRRAAQGMLQRATHVAQMCNLYHAACLATCSKQPSMQVYDRAHAMRCTRWCLTTSRRGTWGRNTSSPSRTSGPRFRARASPPPCFRAPSTAHTTPTPTPYSLRARSLTLFYCTHACSAMR